MLVDMMTGEVLTKIPYPSDYRLFTGRLTSDELSGIKSKINGMIKGNQVVTSDWKSKIKDDPVLSPIYFKAARRNDMLALKFFGLIVWEVFMYREEKWTTGRFERNWELTGSRTYFRID